MTAFLSYLKGANPAFPWFRAVVLALLGIAFVTLGQLPLIDEDEGEYSAVASQMHAHGDYWTPTLNDQPFYEKPILFFWAQQPALAVFGESEIAFRLPSLIAAACLLYVLFQGVRRFYEESRAMDTLIVTGLGLGFVLLARAATMDLLLLLFLTLTLFSYWTYVSEGSRGALRKTYLYAALGFLTKGPVAFVIPALVVFVFAGLSRPDRDRVWRSFDVWGLLGFLGVGMPWFIWYGVHSNGAFTEYFFFRENLGRLGGSLQGHSGSVFYYAIVLPLIVLPYTALLGGAYREVRTRWADSLTRFLLAWFMVVFVFFSLAGTKLPHYLLYGLPPLFILGTGRLVSETRHFGLKLLPSLVLPVLALVLPVVVARLAMSVNNPYLAEMFWEGQAYFDQRYLLLASGWCFLGLLMVGYSFQLRSEVTRRLHLAGIGILSAFGVSLLLLPAVTHLQQDPVREAAALARHLEGPVISDHRMPSFSVYLGHPTEGRAPRAGDIAFGRLDHPERLGSRYETLFAKQGIRLVRVINP